MAFLAFVHQFLLSQVDLPVWISRCVDAINRMKVKLGCGLASKGSLDESHNYSNEWDLDLHSIALGSQHSAAIVPRF